MNMPRSAIRYRSLEMAQTFNPMPPVNPLIPRATRTQPDQEQHLLAYQPLGWHLPFCTGMAITLLILLCGHLIG